MTHGPVDFVAIGFDGNQFKGEMLEALIELVEKEIIRIIDLIIVLKDENGFVAARELQQLDDELMAIFDPLNVHISGMITLEDIELVGEELAPNSTAALMLFENIWAIDDTGWRKLSWRLAAFFVVMAMANEVIWRNFSTDFWIGFSF